MISWNVNNLHGVFPSWNDNIWSVRHVFWRKRITNFAFKLFSLMNSFNVIIHFWRNICFTINIMYMNVAVYLHVRFLNVSTCVAWTGRWMSQHFCFCVLNIFVVVFFQSCCEMYFWAPSRKGWVISIKLLQSNSSFFLIQQNTKSK